MYKHKGYIVIMAYGFGQVGSARANDKLCKYLVNKKITAMPSISGYSCKQKQVSVGPWRLLTC